MVFIALLWVLEGKFQHALWYLEARPNIRVGDIVEERIPGDCTFMMGNCAPPCSQEAFDRNAIFRCKVVLVEVDASMIYAVFNDALGIIMHQYHEWGQSTSARRDAESEKYSTLLEYLTICGGSVMYVVPPFGYEKRHRIVVPTEDTPYKHLDWPTCNNKLLAAASRKLNFDD